MVEESKKEAGMEGGERRGHGACCSDVSGESREKGLPKFQIAIGLAVSSFPWLASVAIMRAFPDDIY